MCCRCRRSGPASRCLGRAGPGVEPVGCGAGGCGAVDRGDTHPRHLAARASAPTCLAHDPASCTGVDAGTAHMRARARRSTGDRWACASRAGVLTAGGSCAGPGDFAARSQLGRLIGRAGGAAADGARCARRARWARLRSFRPAGQWRGSVAPRRRSQLRLWRARGPFGSHAERAASRSRIIRTIRTGSARSAGRASSVLVASGRPLL